jgi:uracil permease
LINSKVDLTKTRNIIIVAVTLTTGIGGAALSWGTFTLSGIGLSAVIGVLLNLILPQESNDEKEVEKAEK